MEKTLVHPDQVLFQAEHEINALPVVEHFAGARGAATIDAQVKLAKKSLALQQKEGSIFDITLDLEDGSEVGHEKEFAEAYVELLNSSENKFNRVGVRIHDITHPMWHKEVEILVRGAGKRLAYLTLPKTRCFADLSKMWEAIRIQLNVNRILRDIPLHVIIETQGAQMDVEKIAAHPYVEVLDFGIMDWVSDFDGVIPEEAMSSPLQWEHPLVVSGKIQVVMAALRYGKVPAHNVTRDINETTRYNTTKEDARKARWQYGFLRMWSIFPEQINAVLEAITPDFSELRTAGEILIRAQKDGWAPIKHNNKMHDRASYRSAWTLIKQAHRLRQPLPDEVLEQFFKK